MADEIKISESDLYANGIILTFPNGDQFLERNVQEFVPEEPVDYHTLGMDEDLDLVAWDFYNTKVQDSSKYWHVLADANQVDDPLDIADRIGSDLIVPNIINFKLRQ